MMKQESNLAGYFEKPIRPEVLIKKVSELLNTITASEERNRLSKEAPVNFDDVL
jgi:hypothetical protein